LGRRQSRKPADKKSQPLKGMEHRRNREHEGVEQTSTNDTLNALDKKVPEVNGKKLIKARMGTKVKEGWWGGFFIAKKTNKQQREGKEEMQLTRGGHADHVFPG